MNSGSVPLSLPPPSAMLVSNFVNDGDFGNSSLEMEKKNDRRQKNYVEFGGWRNAIKTLECADGGIERQPSPPPPPNLMMEKLCFFFFFLFTIVGCFICLI